MATPSPLPLVYACSGCSDVAQLANSVAVALDHRHDHVRSIRRVAWRNERIHFARQLAYGRVQPILLRGIVYRFKSDHAAPTIDVV